MRDRQQSSSFNQSVAHILIKFSINIGKENTQFACVMQIKKHNCRRKKTQQDEIVKIAQAKAQIVKTKYRKHDGNMTCLMASSIWIVQ